MKDQEDEQKRTAVLDGPAKTTNRPRHLAVDSRAGRYVTLTSRRALELDSCISDRIVPRSALSRTGLERCCPSCVPKLNAPAAAFRSDFFLRPDLIFREPVTLNVNGYPG
jgi:hypothetical protein